VTNWETGSARTPGNLPANLRSAWSAAFRPGPPPLRCMAKSAPGSVDYMVVVTRNLTGPGRSSHIRDLLVAPRGLPPWLRKGRG
jgi:hypothetical protein